MRSHTVAAEGGAAAVTRADDSLALHFDDTVSAATGSATRTSSSTSSRTAPRR
jgi:succinate dehydrogenase/fumarate reductase flavoprotein subunit